ncbi:Alpha/Beta hydrolase protein [Cercophora newfieldiana]|uniref:Alpha/Beta hydrolase protein n=1 Tax=Cercophora newfieldiana TaxID=92897 RepID=A0AA40CRV0_9PEZI|nr:Alpha/Beta hydrolase protein [Cercophora newfieldiana]
MGKSARQLLWLLKRMSGHSFCINERKHPRSLAAQLQPITNFGPNKSNTKMFIYEPKDLPANPAIVVGIHYCTSTAQKYYNSNPGLHRLADQKNGGCWDVSSRATLKRDGGADSNGIAEMVRWAVDKYSADKGRVFISILAATYPYLFTAIINCSGVAAGCFFTDSVADWNSTCSAGNIQASPEWWAKWVLDAYPGYNGTRPRVQIYHGDSDTTIAPANITTRLHSGRRERADVPERGYTTLVFGELLRGVYAKGVGHGVPVHAEEDIKFFGL